MKTFLCNNFKDGYRTNNITDYSIQKGKNVEFLNTTDGKGLYMANGNATVAQIANEKVIGGFDYVKSDIHHHLIFTNDGTQSKVYLYENQAFTLLKTGLSKDATHFNAVNFCNGAFITNGIDKQVFYEYGATIPVKDIDATAYTGDKIRGLALQVFDNRIFTNSEGGLYSCGLGDYTDWSSADVETTRAGYVKNFKNSSASLTAIQTYGNNLVIHRTNDITILSGTSGSYSLSSISNAGCPNSFCICNLDILQLYFMYHENGIGLYYLSSNELGVVKPESELSLKVHEEFSNIDTSSLDEIYVIPNTAKSQIWVHLPMTNLPNNAYWLIYDTLAKHFLPPRITQSITSAWIFDGNIYAGTADGKILIEDSGKNFDGQPIEAFARLNSMDFGTLLKKEPEDKFRLKVDMRCRNNFYLNTYKDDDDRKKRSKLITVKSIGGMVWNVSKWGSKWADCTIPTIFKKGKPPKSKQFSVEFYTNGGDFGVQVLEIPPMTVSE